MSDERGMVAVANNYLEQLEATERALATATAESAERGKALDMWRAKCATVTAERDEFRTTLHLTEDCLKVADAELAGMRAAKDIHVAALDSERAAHAETRKALEDWKRRGQQLLTEEQRVHAETWKERDMTEKRRAPLEVLERLAGAVDIWLHCNPKLVTSARTREALAAYRAATAPLRTRQEVDAELLAWVKDSVSTGRHINPTWALVLKLCSEPTDD